MDAHRHTKPKLAALILAAGLAFGASASDTNGTGAQNMAEKPEYIGMAKAAQDGTISMMLRATTPGGAVGEAVLTYKPDDPKYPEIVKHLGGIKPGETKPVPAFPDEPAK
ncbi:MAG: hypothetical protein AB7Q97_10300 [Gammaproteobacteria bacterium]